MFDVDAKLHAGHMKAVKQSVVEGTSKWSAKLGITGTTAAPHARTHARTHAHTHTHPHTPPTHTQSDSAIYAHP